MIDTEHTLGEKDLIMNEGSILVVDDDREIVRSIAIHLEKEGYSVLCAYNGLEALDMVMSPAGLSDYHRRDDAQNGRPVRHHEDS